MTLDLVVHISEIRNTASEIMFRFEFFEIFKKSEMAPVLTVHISKIRNRASKFRFCFDFFEKFKIFEITPDLSVRISQIRNSALKCSFSFAFSKIFKNALFLARNRPLFSPFCFVYEIPP